MCVRCTAWMIWFISVLHYLCFWMTNTNFLEFSDGLALSLPWCGFNHWPWYFHMLWVWPKKLIFKKRSPTQATGRSDQQIFFVSLGWLEWPSDCHSCLFSTCASFCSKAVETLAEGGGSEIQRVKEDAQKKVRQVEELLTKRILLLEEASLEAPRRVYLQWVHMQWAAFCSFFHQLSEFQQKQEPLPLLSIPWVPALF